MGKCHRRHEQRLELWLGCSLDLDNGAGQCFEFAARLHRQQCSHRTCAGRVADRADRLDRRIRHQPQDQCVQRIDVCAERAGQAHVTERVDARMAHQQIDACA